MLGIGPHSSSISAIVLLQLFKAATKPAVLTASFGVRFLFKRNHSIGHVLISDLILHNETSIDHIRIRAST